MTTRTRAALSLLVLSSAATLGGCYGPTNEKGDNGGSLITPKPGAVEDANTAGTRDRALPPPEKAQAKTGSATEGGPK